MVFVSDDPWMWLLGIGTLPVIGLPLQRYGQKLLARHKALSERAVAEIEAIEARETTPSP